MNLPYGLIAHVKHDTTPPRTELVKMTLSPCLPKHQKSGSKIHQHVFPDSGASICLANFKHLQHMNLSPSKLIPRFKKVTAVAAET